MPNFPQSGVQLVAQDADSFISALRDADNAVDTFGRTAEKSGGGVSAFGEIVKGALREVGALATQALVSAGQAVASFAVDSVKAAGDFESGMLQFSAAAGDALASSGMSLEQFRDQFIAMGRELPVSTAEVQQAAIELVKGGIDPATIAAGGLRTALDLAAAGGVGLAESAEILANQLGVWVDASASAADKAAFLTQAADLLSQAANVTTKDVDDMALGLANVGGVAELAGLDFQELVQTMALISPNFASAADAGTSFKTFLNNLIPTTDPAIQMMTDLGLYTEQTGSAFYDASGSFIGMEQAAAILNASLAGLSEEQRALALETIFGSDAQRAAAAIAAAGAEGYAAMGAQMDAAGTVAEQAAARQQGFNTAMENAKGSVEALQITIGTYLLPILTDLLNNVIAPAINTLTTMADAVFGNAEAFAQLSGPAQAVVVAIQETVAAVQAAAAAFASGGLDAGIASLAQSFGMGGQQAQAFASVISGAIQAAIGIIQGLAATTSAVLSGIAGFWQTHGAAITATAMQTFGAVQGFIAAVMPAIQAVVSAVLGQISTFWANNGAQITASVVQAWQTIQGIIQGVMALLGPIISAGLTTIASFITAHGAQIQSLFTNTWNAINALITGVLALINGVVQAALALMQGDTEGAMNALKDAFATAWESIKTIFSSALDNLITLLDMVTGDFVSGAIEIGQGIISGITSAIQAGASQIVDTLVNLANQALDQVKAALGITSPSKVFAEQVGEPITLGIAEGILSQAQAARDAAAGLADEILDELDRLAEQAADAVERALSNALAGAASLLRGGAGAAALFGNLYPKTSDIAKAEKAIADAQKRITGLNTPTARKASKAQEELGTLPRQRKAVQKELDDELATLAVERERLQWTAQYNDSLDKREQAQEKLLDLDQKEKDLRAKAAKEQQAIDRKEHDLRTKIYEENKAYQEQEQVRLGKLKEARDALAAAEAQRSQAQQKYNEQADIAMQAQTDLAAAQLKAQEIAKTDPKLAADFLDMRSRQIGELAKLQQQAAATEDERLKQGYLTQIDLIRRAQTVETLAFEENARRRAADLARLGDDTVATGNAMVDGIVQGIVESADKIGEAMNAAIGKAMEDVQAKFAIKSPSLVWAEQIGVPLMEGIGAGIFAALPGVEAGLGAALGHLTGAARVQPANAATYNQQSYVSNLGGNTVNINGSSLNMNQLAVAVARAMDASGARADVRVRTR